LKLGGTDSTAILELDVRFFSAGATATGSEKIEAVLTLMQVFVTEPTDGTDGADAVPPSMRRAVQKTETVKACDSIFVQVLKRAEQLSERMIAGILLLDIVSYSWERHSFEAE